MARQSEEIDDKPASGGGASTVMVGGMDDLIPGGKKEDDNLDVVVEERKPPPGRRLPESDDDREEDARLAYDVSEDDEIEERGLSRRQRRNRQRKTVVAGRDQVIDALNAKVDALTNTINSMGQSQVGLTINNLDTQLGAAHQALNLADVEIKKAVGAGDLARYEELRGLREEAQTRYAQLYRTKQGIAQELQARGGQEKTFAFFQAINFIQQTDGRLYMVGFHNSFFVPSFLPGRDHADLYEVVFPENTVNSPTPVLAMPSVTKVATRLMQCTGGYCNLDAAGGLFVDPDTHALSVYATPGWLNGDTVKFTVYREAESRPHSPPLPLN